MYITTSDWQKIQSPNSTPDGAGEQDPRAAPRRRGAQEGPEERPQEEGLLRQQHRVRRQEGPEGEEGAEAKDGLGHGLGRRHHEDAFQTAGRLYSVMMS